MKRLFSVLFIISFQISGQVVKVPQKVQFTDVTINLDATAQKIVQNEVNTLLLPSKFLDSKLERMQMFLPIIETILTEEEVPADFKYTPVTESSLLPDAISSSNAVGFWQIKGITGQELGLRIDNEVDERQNIFSSTRAASNYLKRNNILYKNWVSTLLSYYMGATGVSKLIPQDWQFSDEISIDGKADRYLYKNIAQKLAFDDRINRLRENRFSIFEYKNGRGKTLEMIAKELNVSLEDLKLYNIWLKVNQIPNDKDYSVTVVVPTEQFSELVTNTRKVEKETDFVKTDVGFPLLKKITVSSIDPDAAIFYEINEKRGVMANIGDTYETIATRAKVDPKEFLQFNDMQPNDMINGDEVYYLEKKEKKAKIPFHTVKSDQSLRQISNIYGVQLASLLKYNRMENVQRVQPGRVLWLRKRRPRNKQVEYVTDYQTPEISDKVEPKVPVKSPIEDKKPPISPKKDTKKDDEGWIEVPVDNTSTSKPFPTSEPVVSKPNSDVNTTKNKPYTPASSTKPVEWEAESTNSGSGSTTTNPTKSTTNSSTTTTYPSTTTTYPSTTTTYPSTTTSSSNANYHSVDVGNTVYSIARQYGVSVKELYAWNGLNADSRLYIGQQILVSNPNGSISANPKPIKTTSNSNYEEKITYHTVTSGENLFRIGLKYNVSVEQLKQWNGLSDNSVKVGQKIKIKK
jgi:membrane-bound lytic murein transglycosylase D